MRKGLPPRALRHRRKGEQRKMRGPAGEMEMDGAREQRTKEGPLPLATSRPGHSKGRCRTLGVSGRRYRREGEGQRHLFQTA